MNIINIIRTDMANPACLGFFFESDGNSVSVSKLDDGSIRATYESWKGTRNIVNDESMDNIESHISMLHEIDPYGTYCPSFKPTKWSDGQIERFMEDIPISLYDYYFRGFELKADGAETFVVRKNDGGCFYPWIVDGKGGDFVDVINKTRAKLNENVYWEYAAL